MNTLTIPRVFHILLCKAKELHLVISFRVYNIYKRLQRMRNVLSNVHKMTLLKDFTYCFVKFKHHSGIGPMQLRKTLSAIELQLFVNKASAQINIYVGKGLSVKSRIIGMWGCNKEKTAEYTLIGHIITYTCSTAC